MVVIIKLFNNIISLMKMQEFKKRFISTTVLSFLFILLFLFGNPFVSIFFSLLFCVIFFEYEKLTVKILKKQQFFKIFLFQILLLFFTILEINEFEFVYLFFNNFITFLSISVFSNTIFLLYKKTK